MSSTAEPKKTPTIKMNFTVEMEGKEGMTLKDIAAVNEKAEAIRAKLKEYGVVKGDVVIGKQVFEL
jgi:hypothetical protein